MFEKIQGDLNGDGLEDDVLIVKGTDKENIVLNRAYASYTRPSPPASLIQRPIKSIHFRFFEVDYNRY